LSGGVLAVRVSGSGLGALSGTRLAGGVDGAGLAGGVSGGGLRALGDLSGGD